MSNNELYQSGFTLIKEWKAEYETVKHSRERIHQLLIKTVLHLYEHGNVNVLKHAIDEQPDGLDKTAFANWVNKYVTVNVKYDSRAGEHTVTLIKASKEERVKLLTAGKEDRNRWWKSTKKSGFEGFDQNKVIQAAITQAQNALKKATALHKAGEPVPEVKYSKAKMDALLAALALPEEIVDFSARASNDADETELAEVAKNMVG